MTGWILVVSVAVVVYLDATALERADSIVYRDTVGREPVFWAGLAFFVLPSALAYYLRRRRCLQRLEEETENLVFEPDHRFRVAREASGVFILWILLLVPIGAALRWGWSDPEDLGLWAVSGMASQLLLTGLIAGAVHRRRDAGFWQVTGWSASPISPLLAFVLPLLAGLGLALGAAWSEGLMEPISLTGETVEGAGPFGGLFEPASSPVTEAFESASGSAIVWWSLAAFLVAPFLEELIFRGYLFRVVSTLEGRAAAFGVTSVAFAVMHFEQYWTDWLSILTVSLVGATLGGLRLATRSTLSSTVAHYAYNVGLMVVPFVLVLSQASAMGEVPEESVLQSPAGRQESYEVALEADPDDPGALAGLARSLAEQDLELERAYELVERALRARPEDPGFLDTRAEILFRRGNEHEAIAIERWLVREHPEVDHYRVQLERFLGEGDER